MPTDSQPDLSDVDPFEIIDDTPDRDTEAERERREAELAGEDAHLDTRHIKAILAEKKALYRHGTYMTIIAVVLLVVAVELIYMAASDFRARSPMRNGASIVIAIGLAIFAVRFVRRSLELRREAAATILPAETREPDFSALNDGSQFAENLNHLHENGR